MPRSAPLTAIDLFCGCGGLTLGLKQARFRVLGAIDIDSLAVETYRANHPEVMALCRDLRRVCPFRVMKSLRLQPGQLDLLAGCPPCQGFSSIRTLNGRRDVSDDRNDLLFDFLRFIKAIRPKAVMMENVPGLKDYARFPRFVRELKKMGYKVASAVLNAADYEVPQRRNRLIVLAGTGRGIPPAVEVIRQVVVRDAIFHLDVPGHTGDPLHDFPENRTAKVRDLIAAIPHDGGSRADLGPERQLPCHQRTNGFKDIYGRMAWGAPAPTITGGCYNPSKGRFLHPEQDRAITLREAALLQSFPPNYKFSLKRGKSGVAEMIGNALPPTFIKHHSRQIRMVLQGRRLVNRKVSSGNKRRQ